MKKSSGGLSSDVALLILLGFLGSSFVSRGASEVVTWGATNGYGLGIVPPSLTNVVALAAGSTHSVALKSDGTVAAWGNNVAGQTNVPAGLGNVAAIAAAWNHSLALLSNGTVAAWGDPKTVPAGLTNVAAIAAGDMFSLALTGLGEVVAWGSSGGTNVPGGLSNVVAIAAGGAFGVALKGDGTLSSWGSPPSIAGLTNVAAMAAGEFPLITLRADMTVAAGPTRLSNAVAVAASRYSGLALEADGSVMEWTGGAPTRPPLSNVVAIAAGQGHSLALVGGGAPFLTTALLDRSVPPGGMAVLYALATGAAPLSYQWRCNGTNLSEGINLILALTNVLPANSGGYSVVVTNGFGSVTSAVAVVTVTDFSAALNTTGLVWTTGGNAPWFVETGVAHDGVSAMQSGVISNYQNARLQTALTGPGTLSFWWKVTGPAANSGLSFQIGNAQQAFIHGTVDWKEETVYLGAGPQIVQWVFSSGIITSAGPVAGWVDEVSFVEGGTAPFFTSQPKSQSQAAGFDATFAAAVAGTPPLSYQWRLDGCNLSNATASSLTVTGARAADVGEYSLRVTNIAGTAVSSNASFGLGQIAAWGDNNYGQMIVPAGMTDIVAVAAGSVHSLALTADGRVRGWGDNWQVPDGLTNVVAIASAAGASHDLALKADGTVLAWGDNSFGQTNVPTDLSNVVAIAAGWNHSLALRSDGSVVTWGYLGTNVPSDMTNVVAIAGGGYHSLALTANGTVVAWGNVDPAPADLTNGVAIAGGLFYATAVRADGTVAAWGDNSHGQTNVPAGLGGVARIAAGWYHSLAIGTDGMVLACDAQTTLPPALTNVAAVALGLFHNLALEERDPPKLGVPMINPQWGWDGFSLSLPTQSGRVYGLEYKSSLTDPAWTALPLVAGNGGIRTLTDPAPQGPQRFYRVRRW